MPKFFKSLQLLRALAFLSIFFFHATVLDDAFSRWSITAFLMLSGFLNALHGYDKELSCDIRSSIKYATRKIKGIYPLHLVMFAFAFALYVFSNRADIFANTRNRLVTGILKILTNVFLVSDWGPKHGWWYNIFSEYNIVTWYLSLSLLLFLLTPLFLQIMHRIYDTNSQMNHWIRPLIVSVIIYLITILINIVFVYAFGKEGSFLYVYESPLSRAGDYLIALQAGYVYLAKNKSDNVERTDKESSILYAMLILGTAIISVVLLTVGICIIPVEGRWIVSTGFYFSIPTAILIFSLAMFEELVERRLVSGKLTYKCVNVLLHIGSISQYAFLIHVPIINFIHGVYSRLGNVNLAIWSVVSFIITMVLSELVLVRKKK